jgi:predicted ATPase
LAIPTTLQDSLMARLDRLATAREVAQLGAALGREFSYEMINAVSSMEETALQQALGQLIEAEVLYRRDRPPRASYVFKHALIRDAAYESLLRSRRHVYHDRIARVLEERFPETRETQPELLAHHYTQAGVTEQAIVYWQRAGQRAIERSASVEAIAYLTQGLELIPLLPEGARRAQHELALRIALGMPLIATKGYAGFEVERTYARARELSLQVGETPQLPTIVWGLWVFYLTGGSLETALQMAERYRTLAERLQETPLLLETCQLMGNTLFYLGEFSPALPYLEQGSRLYDPVQHHPLIFEHGGADTGVAIMTHEALALWALGYPDRARERMHAALHCARTLAHPFSLAFAHYFFAWFHKLSREEATVHESATAAISICDEYGFPFWGLSSAGLRGSAVVEQGAEEEGIAVMRQALTAFEAIGAQLFRPELLGLLGAALGRTGRPGEGLAVLSKAFTAMEKSQERWWSPELHRLRGELLRALPGDHAREAESALQEALTAARRQQARSWELRAAISLSRLWQQQGKAKEGRDLLMEIYRWFTEGFQTADLREARALLADLEH